MLRTLTTLLLFAVIPVSSALAQRAVTQGEAVEMTAEIVAIDRECRRDGCSR